MKLDRVLADVVVQKRPSAEIDALKADENYYRQLVSRATAVAV